MQTADSLSNCAFGQPDSIVEETVWTRELMSKDSFVFNAAIKVSITDCMVRSLFDFFSDSTSSNSATQQNAKERRNVVNCF